MALFWKRKEVPPEFETIQPGQFIEGPPSPPGSPEQGAPAPAGESLDSKGPTETTVKNDSKPVETPKAGIFGRVRTALSQRLQKTRQDIVGQIREAIKAAGKVDEHLLDRIEEILIQADVGAETTMRIVDEMREFEARGASPDELLSSFKSQLHRIIGKGERTLAPAKQRPYVILVIGVNGVGKTTTIGKLAAEYRESENKTMLVAGDTFRAAAIEQLEIWSNRTGSVIEKREMGSDSSGLAYDAVQKAVNEKFDIVLIDTAGRQHTKTNLMEELKKIVRVIEKVMPGAPHEIVLVLDATTGQNAIQQAKVFTEAIPVSAIVMTKLDGTAKGGVLIGVRNLFDIPVVKIGIGEGVEDLRDFNPGEFVDALFSE
jgi:fused signal recognition particle receptor